MLELEHLKKIYNKNEILSDINYTFEENNVYCILGGHDAGINMLFSIICQDIPYDEGKLKIRNSGPKRKVEVSFAAKQSVLPMYISGLEFVDFLCDFKRKTEKPVNYLKRVGIPEDMWNVMICDYNFETKKRLQLAAFLIQQPYVVMFEDPFDYCSEEYVDMFIETLREYSAGHIILVSTGVLEVAKKMSDDIIMLTNGELHEISSEVLEAPEVMQAVLERLGELE